MQIQNYRQSRNVPKLRTVPAKLRQKMLRNCIRFEAAVPREDNSYVFQQTLERGLDQHTNRLFHLSVHEEPTPMSADFRGILYVSIFFEKYEDLERFQKHFMVIHKLST